MRFDVRVPILDVLGADELRLIVEALLDPASCYEAATVAVHRLRCCARAFLRRGDERRRDAARAQLTLGHPYRAYRAPWWRAVPASTRQRRANGKVCTCRGRSSWAAAAAQRRDALEPAKGHEL